MRLNRRTFIGVAAALPLTAIRKPSPKPNVIVVLTDDQGYGDLSCHGNPVLKTPNLDRLHEESVRLTDFHSAPICSPTRSQLLTGVDALRNGAFAWAHSRELIRRDVPTMAEVFAANDYRTGHFGKWHLGHNYPYRPDDRGFHETIHFDGACQGQTPDYWNNDCFDDFYWHNGKLQQYPGYSEDLWFDESIKFVNACKARKEPFFVYLATHAPHSPLFVPDRYRQPYKNQPEPLPSFFGMVANIDGNMGRLETFLEKAGLRENTILIWLTDNGANASGRLFNAGMRGGKGQYYDGGHRVPCFLRWPGGRLRAPADIDALTQMQDLLPTLIDLCGLRLPSAARFDGTSLAPLLRGENRRLSGRMLVVQSTTVTWPRKWEAALMWDKWRLVKGEELYNIASDPGQKSDVAAQNPEIVQRMKAHYERWWSEVEPRIKEPAYIPVGSDHEDPTRLSCFDWFDYRSSKGGGGGNTGQSSVRNGAKMNGPWNIEVLRDGVYEIALRRWPVEADTPIIAGLPPYTPWDPGAPGRNYPEGKALLVDKARLKIAQTDEVRAVKPDDKAISFLVPLQRGKTQLETWFYDVKGEELCGAYYVYVHRTWGSKP